MKRPGLSIGGLMALVAYVAAIYASCTAASVGNEASDFVVAAFGLIFLGNAMAFAFVILAWDLGRRGRARLSLVGFLAASVLVVPIHAWFCLRFSDKVLDLIERLGQPTVEWLVRMGVNPNNPTIGMLLDAGLVAALFVPCHFPLPLFVAWRLRGRWLTIEPRTPEGSSAE
jgi:hypothetical protein